MLAYLVNLHDIGMGELRDNFRLTAKARSILRTGMAACQDHFQRYNTTQAFLSRLVDDAHTALAQALEKLIAGHVGTRWHRARSWRRESLAGRRRYCVACL